MSVRTIRQLRHDQRDRSPSTRCSTSPSSSTSSFSVSFSSPQVARQWRCLRSRVVDHSSLVPPCSPPNARKDINMEKQYRTRTAERIQQLSLWSTNQAAKNTQREVAEGKHYLMILMATALKRQEELGSMHLCNTIFRKLQAGPNNSSSSAASTVREDSEIRASPKLAYDLPTVRKCLVDDICALHDYYGYAGTMRSLNELDLWAVDDSSSSSSA